jgi:hypothetical protein
MDANNYAATIVTDHRTNSFVMAKNRLGTWAIQRKHARGRRDSWGFTWTDRTYNPDILDALLYAYHFTINTPETRLYTTSTEWT